MRLATATALLLLAGCGEEQPLPPERPNAQVAKPRTAPIPRRFEFAGRWAVSPDMCATGWWDFGGDDIRTAGEVGCSVVQDERTETTATLQLTCVGEGMPTVETWQISGSTDRLTVDRGELPVVTLTRCPEFH